MATKSWYLASPSTRRHLSSSVASSSSSPISAFRYVPWFSTFILVFLRVLFFVVGFHKLFLLVSPHFSSVCAQLVLIYWL